MIGPEFSTCHLKLGRSEEHFNTFHDELIAWQKSDPYAITLNGNTDGSRYGITVDILKPAPLDRWSLIAGDCVHNLRSALDHFMHALAIRDSGSNPPPNAASLQFPITSCAKAFNDEWARRKMSSAIKATTQARIERLQPYNRPHHALPPLLGLIRDFDNADKHRLLNVTMEHFASGQFKFFFPSGVVSGGRTPTIKAYNLRTAVKSGAEFQFFTVNPPSPGMNCEYQTTFYVSVAHRIGPKGHVSELRYVLNALIEEVKAVINILIL